jgi:hypothetical protein
MGFGPWVNVIRVTLDEIRVFPSVRFLPQIFSDDVIPKERHRACSSGG